MESRKKRLGSSKFGVWYEIKTNVLHDRANVHSPRAWLDTLDYHEIQAFSWRLLREYLFQLLTCRVSNSYDVNLAKNCLDSWMKSHPNGQTYLSLLLPIESMDYERQDEVVITCHFFLILIGSEKIREILWHLEVTKIRFGIISQASHSFFPTRYLNLFF